MNLLLLIRNPLYAISKLYSYWTVKNYRDSYGFFTSNGILFNHESPVRGETFVTRKITRALCRIKIGTQKKVVHWKSRLKERLGTC